MSLSLNKHLGQMIDQSTRIGETTNRLQKIPSQDVGYMDPYARKNAFKNSVLYHSHDYNYTFSKNEIIANANKNKVWPFNQQDKRFIASPQFAELKEQLEKGTPYMSLSPELREHMSSRGVLEALGYEADYLVFAKTLLSTIETSVDSDRIKANVNTFLSDNYPDSLDLSIDCYIRDKGLTDRDARVFQDSIRYHSAQYAENFEKLKNWFLNEDGYLYVASVRYIDTVSLLRDTVLSCKTYEEISNLMTPEWFMDYGFTNSVDIHRSKKKEYIPVSLEYNSILGGRTPLVVYTVESMSDSKKEAILNKSARDGNAFSLFPVIPPDSIIDGNKITYVQDGAYKTLVLNGNAKVRYDQLVNSGELMPNTYMVYNRATNSFVFNIAEQGVAEEWSRSFYKHYNYMCRQRAYDVPLHSITRRGLSWRSSLENYNEDLAVDKNGVHSPNVRAEEVEDGTRRIVEDKKGELFERFGIKGLVSGNNVPQIERTMLRNAIYDGLLDMEYITGLNAKSLINGELNISYGSSGEPDSLAYYRPYTNTGEPCQIISLNRDTGLGSFSHEFKHFFDHRLCRLVGEKCGFSSFNRPMSFSEQFNESLGRFASINAMTKLKAEYPATYRLMEMVCKKDSPVFLKKMYHNAELLDGKTKYWSRPCEMLARAAACYFADKLKDENFKNDFLNGTSDVCIPYLSYNVLTDDRSLEFIPKGVPTEERELVKKVFDGFLKEMGEKQLVQTVNREDIKGLYEARTGQKTQYSNVVSENTTPVFSLNRDKNDVSASSEKLNYAILAEPIAYGKAASSLTKKDEIVKFMARNSDHAFKTADINLAAKPAPSLDAR